MYKSNRFFALSLLALTLPLQAQDTHDLQLAAKAGSSVCIAQATTMTQVIDMGGQEVASTNTMHIVMSVAVKTADDKGTSVEATIERTHGKFSVPMMGDYPFDSLDHSDDDDAPEAPEPDAFGMPDFDAIATAAASMIGTKYTALLDASGRVVSIEGVETTLGKLKERAGETGMQMLAQSFGEAPTKVLIESAFGERPKKPLAVGASWSAKTPNETGFVSHLKQTLAQVSDDSFEITGVGTLSEPAIEPETEGETEEEKMMRDMQSRTKVEESEIKGRTVISRKDDFVIEANSEIKLTLKMPSPLGGDMTIQHTTTVSTKRTTKEAAMQREGEDK